MKQKTMRTMHKCMSLLLIAAMLVTTWQVPVQAETAETENTMESVKLTVSAYNDFANLSNEISDYVNRIVAVIEGAMYVLNNDIKGRTMYFNSYLSNRGNYSSADDDI